MTAISSGASLCMDWYIVLTFADQSCNVRQYFVILLIRRMDSARMHVDHSSEIAIIAWAHTSLLPDGKDRRNHTGHCLLVRILRRWNWSLVCASYSGSLRLRKERLSVQVVCIWQIGWFDRCTAELRHRMHLHCGLLRCRHHRNSSYWACAIVLIVVAADRRPFYRRNGHR